MLFWIKNRRHMGIKILLVDDDEIKRKTIVSRLYEISSDIFISTASNVKDAKRELKTATLDLLIIDLVIPLTNLTQQPSRTGGLTLLEWLEDEECKPGYIVGMSSFTDVADEQAVEFSDRSWCVLRYDSSTTAWFDQLRTLIQHIQGAKRQALEEVYKSDVLVVTALRDPELEAVLNIGWNFDAILQPVAGRQFIRKGRKNRQNGEILNVSAGATSKMGMVWTSLFVSNAIKLLRPRMVAMTGICMGHPAETALGDIVVAVHSWNWQAGRLSARADGSPFFESQPEPVVASKLLVNLLDDMAADSYLLKRIYNEFEGEKPAEPPKLRVAPMVSGSVVIAHDCVHADIFEQDRKIRAVDMETFGIYAACESIEDLAPLFISIKSVSDLGLPDKDNKYQKYCAYASARVLDFFLDKYWDNVVGVVD
ncbi:hypothetical protein [Achromobacter xylosoxidans]|uniref:phosphorylase family protein n=1 Tax=Alcaligenes xylosoxydans xylosoxydans TaxID=85698 RepID=UPI0022B8C136|nr:hypothetical protein [Achromobacter xylosoxidans]MCZ8437132.1 hypothetical protein [Achromobacter xylosoxidans]